MSFISNIKKLRPEPIYLVMIKRLALVYLLFSACRIGFYLYNTSYFPEVSFSRLMYLMLAGLKFDTVAIVYTNSLFIILHIIPLKIRYHAVYQRITAWVFYITNSIALSANVIDFIYFPFTLKRTTFTVFREFWNEEHVVKLLLRFAVDYWYGTIFMAALILLVMWLYKRIKLPPLKISSNLRYYAFALAMIAVISGLFVAGARGGFRHSTRPITLSNAGEYVKHPKETHIVLNTPFCIYKTLTVESLKPIDFYTEQELTALYNPVRIPKPDSSFIQDNVVFIILESFGKEATGYFNKNLENGSYKGFTPFLDSLCEYSLVFEESYANGHKSIDALPSVITSTPSLKEPFVLTEYFDNDYSSIATLLKEKGYHTSFFHGAPNGSMGFSSFIKLAGIEEYYGKTEYGNDDDFDGIWGIWDEPFFDFYQRTLGKFKQPFFSTIFSASSHSPFDLPKKYDGVFPEGKHKIYRTIGYTDHALRKFFKEASKQSWYKNTLFVITADHCQSEPVHKKYLTSTGLFSVPVIFYHPSGNFKGNGKGLIQQIDIMPTVLGMLNYDEPYFSFGFDVFNHDDRFVINYVNSTYQIIKGDFVLNFDGNQTVGFYNKHEDPFLEDNLKNDNLVERKELEKYVKAFIQQYNNRMIANDLKP